MVRCDDTSTQSHHPAPGCACSLGHRCCSQAARRLQKQEGCSGVTGLWQGQKQWQSQACLQSQHPVHTRVPTRGDSLVSPPQPQQAALRSTHKSAVCQTGEHRKRPLMRARRCSHAPPPFQPLSFKRESGLRGSAFLQQRERTHRLPTSTRQCPNRLSSGPSLLLVLLTPCPLSRRTHSSLQSSSRRQARLSACWDGKVVQQQPLQPLDLGARPSDGSARKGSSRSWRGASTSGGRLQQTHVQTSHRGLQSTTSPSSSQIIAVQQLGRSLLVRLRVPHTLPPPEPLMQCHSLSPGQVRKSSLGGGQQQQPHQCFPLGSLFDLLAPQTCLVTPTVAVRGRPLCSAPLPKLSLCHRKVGFQRVLV